MIQNVHRAIVRTVPQSYRARGVRHCLQEVRQMKKTSENLPCRLKKTNQQEWCQHKPSSPLPLHLPTFLSSSVAAFPSPGPQTVDWIMDQSSQLLLHAGVCDRSQTNYFSWVCRDTGEIPSLLRQPQPRVTAPNRTSG